jgi:hypothetical protein
MSQETPQMESKIVDDQEVVLETNEEVLESSQGNEQLKERKEEVVPIRRSSRDVQLSTRL